MKSITSFQTRTQRGFVLLKALVILSVLALGLFGLAAVQSRMAVETRSANARANALRLVNDLSERMQRNPMGAHPPAMATGGLSAYSDSRAASFQGAVKTDKDCAAAGPCTPAEQAAYDRAIWRTKVARLLPDGQASIWQISPRQLYVVITWRAPENGAQQAARPQPAAAAASMCGPGAKTICHYAMIAIPPG